MPTTASFTGQGIAPSVVSASMTGSIVRVLFSEAMSTSGLTTLSNYTIPGMTILRADVEPRSSNTAVLLTVTGFQPLTQYNVTVSNVTDIAGNTVA